MVQEEATGEWDYGTELERGEGGNVDTVASRGHEEVKDSRRNGNYGYYCVMWKVF